MRYFFHIRDHDDLIEDEIGLELPTLRTAELEASAAARDFRRDAALSGDNVDHQIIEVTNADGRILLRVSVKDSVSDVDGSAAGLEI